MKKMLLALAFLLLPISSYAAGPFDGIYSLNFGGTIIGYTSIHEDETNNIIAIVFDVEPFESDWDAVSGTRNGSNVTLNSIAGTVNLNISVVFNDSNSGVATINSCDGDCDFPNGTALNLNRLF